MNGDEVADAMDRDEDEELAELGRALGYDEDREPPADRVAALRAQAERLRAGDGADGTGGADGAGGGGAGWSGRRRSLLVGGIAAAVGALAGAGARQLALPEQKVVPTEDLALTGVPPVPPHGAG